MLYENAEKLRPGWERPPTAWPTPRRCLKPNFIRHRGAVGRRLPRSISMRMFDPALHHTFLSQLHQATIDREEKGKELEQVRAKVEPAIKELSSCLLYANGPRSELEECVDKFEAALKNVRQAASDEMQSSVARVKNSGENMPAV